MRNYIFTTLLFAISSIPSTAQNYHPILNEDNSWTIFHIGPNCEYAMMDSIFTLTDSIVGTKIYTAVYNWSDQNQIGTTVEDTLDGTLTYFDESKNSFPVFDISLLPGDTLNFYSYNNFNIELVVTDTTRIDGLKHIIFHTDNYSCGSFGADFTMVESVGPNIGIHNFGHYTEGSYHLLCNYKSGTFYYGNDLFNNECYLDWNDIHIEENTDVFQINFDTKEITIINHLKNGTLSIFNLQGIKLLDEELLQGRNYINTSYLKPGIYIIMIHIDNTTYSDIFSHQ